MAKTFTIVTRVGYVLASLVIIFALLVSVGRLLTPYLNDHLPDFESWSSDALKLPVKIRHVEISWNVYEPEIAFQEVMIIDQATQKPRFAVQEIKVNLNIFRSLLTWSPILESVKIRGAHLTIVQPPKGLPLIEELKGLSVMDNSTEMSSQLPDVLAWIFTQQSLILQEIDITYKEGAAKAKSISVDRLVLKNDSNYHQLYGDALLNQDMPLHVQTHLDWTGSVTDLEHVSANIYCYIEGLSLAQWLSQYEWNQLKIDDGVGSAKVWLTWGNNQFQKIQSQFQFYDLKIHSAATKTPIDVPRLSGHVGWLKKGDQEIFAGNDLLIDLPDHLWPTTSFQLIFAPDEQGTKKLKSAQVQYMDLTDVQHLGILSGLLPQNILQTLTTINPRGEMMNLTVLLPKGSFDDLNSMSIGMKFLNISLDPWQDYPGLIHTTGVVTWNGKKGSLVLDSPKSGIDYQKIFQKALMFDHLALSLQWEHSTDGTWSVLLKNFQALNREINAQARMSLTIPQNDSPMINLSGNFNLKNAAAVSNYLPIKTYEPDLVAWIKQAFIKGRVESGNAILQGKLSDYPFDNGKGTFRISGMIHDMELQFDPKWPKLTRLNGELIFAGSAMTAQFTSAKMLNATITNLQAKIPYLGPNAPQILSVNGDIKADLTQAMQVIRHSPLQNTLGKDLADLNPKGPMELKLALTIPLKTPDSLTLTGDLNLMNSALEASVSGLTLDQLTGMLHFTEKDVQGQKIQGRIFNAPAILDVTTVTENEKPIYLKANIASTLSVIALQEWLKTSLTSYAKGSTAYTAELHLASHNQPRPSEIIVKSDLNGIEINLPDKLGKKADEKRDFSTYISLSPHKPLLVTMEYNKFVSAALGFAKVNQGTQFYNGEIRFGGAKAVLPTQPGLLITAQFPTLDLTMLQPYISFVTKKNNEDKALNKPIDTSLVRGINLDANVFDLWGQRLNNAHIQLSHKGTLWTVNMNSTQIVGQITASDTFKDIQAKFQRFYVTSGGERVKESMNPRTIPILNITANDVKYGDLRLGSITINTVPTQTGLQIKQLQMNSGPTRITATGLWQANKQNGTTHLQGTMETPNINQTLKQWGMGASSLIGSTANASFDLTWPDAPYNPSLKNILGNLTVTMGHGRIVNLSDSTEAKIGLGRMLSIFSLQSIPRRLSLDFSDLFQNGYSFDSIKGNFKLRGGNAYTTDLHFDGTIASINLGGRIGFQAKDFGLSLGVTTYVTSSFLPAAVGWLGGPITGVAGVATWLLGTAMSQASSKVATYQYSITGPWSNPQWRQIGSAKVSAPPPPRR